ncbi:MAG: hypothetical protein GC137_02130 [Alphaproteobacteria bacterium]|nr:hypothetical protein [Alphaproteobacteria bacterium]
MINSFTFVEGAEAAELTRKAIEARNTMGRLANFDWRNSQETQERQRQIYLEHLNALPFTQHCATISRQKMGAIAGATVLDLGSSYCPDLEELNTDMDGHGTLICVDIVQDALDKAKAKHEVLPDRKIHLMTKVSLDGIARDSVFGSRSLRTLQHVENPVEILTQMTRVTAGGGHVITIDPDWTSLHIEGSSFDKTFEHLFFTDGERHYDIKNPSAGRVSAAWMESAGLEHVKVEKHTLKAELFDRADLAMGITRRLNQAVKAHRISEQESENMLAQAQRDFSQGQAYMLIDYYICDGTSPG